MNQFRMNGNSVRSRKASLSLSLSPSRVQCWALIVASAFLVFVVWNEEIPRQYQRTIRQLKKMDDVPPYQREDVIFGHVHMARTAGSSLNWNLSNHYERVCGNKGYSYDAYVRGAGDSKHHDVVASIGFEDCDYISIETGEWDFWVQFDDFHDTPMELHVPCREPIDYFMSLCNYEKARHRAGDFDCDGISTDEDLANAVNVCLRFVERFNDKLNELEHVHLKCFDFKHQFTTYLDYMATKLQPRRFVSEAAKTQPLRTPWPRDEDKECIWKNEALKKRVENYLVTEVPYFRYCNKCVGSEDDVTRVDVEEDGVDLIEKEVNGSKVEIMKYETEN